VSVELGRSLLLADALPAEALGRALLTSLATGRSLLAVLVDGGAIDEARLEAELARAGATPIDDVKADRELMSRLPPGLCERMLVVPLRRDAETGAVHIAVADPRDRHPAEEIAYFLRAEVRAFRARIAAIRDALFEAAASPRAHALAAPIWMTEDRKGTPMWGTPIVSVSPSVPHVSEMPIPLTRRSFPPSEDAAPTQREPEPVFALLSRRPPSMYAPAAVTASPIPTPPFADAQPVLAALGEATDRDAIIALLLSGARAVARRIGIFAVKREAFLGWTCSPELCDPHAFRALSITTSLPSVFAGVASGSDYLGPLYRTEAHAPLLDLMGTTARDLAIVPVRVHGHAALLLLADELGDSALSTKRMLELAHAAGSALARVLRSRTS
jgi:hypothetical protein